MLELPDVTLVSIDCVTPDRTIRAMHYSMFMARFKDAMLLTDSGRVTKESLKTIGGQGRMNIRTLHSNQGGRTDYEESVIRDLHALFPTTHCLYQEWDAAVLNPKAWNPEWLAYDYIGAAWPWGFNEVGYPPCTESNCVGNGGFSLRSRRFCYAVADLFDSSPGALRSSDSWICRTLREPLVKAGMKFAPQSVADEFSCENRIYTGQFGFHGKNTIKLNGWDWGLEWLR